MKNKILLPVTVILVCTLNSCASLQTILQKKPAVKISEIQLHSFNLKEVNLIVNAEIKNPYPLELNFMKVAVDTFIRGKFIQKIESIQNIKIAGEGTAISSFKVKLNYKQIGEVVKDYLKRDHLLCDLKFKFLFKLPEIAGLQQNAIVEAKGQVKIPGLKSVIKKRFLK